MNHLMSGLADQEKTQEQERRFQEHVKKLRDRLAINQKDIEVTTRQLELLSTPDGRAMWELMTS